MSLSLKATQADGYYQPPDYDSARHGTLNKINKTHRLGNKKLQDGGVIIVFEMPFKVWCLGCDSIIAKGVRFNAEKRKVGKYMSTDILEFLMTCKICHHQMRIRTDPENTDYTCYEGCRPRVETFDSTAIGLYEYSTVAELIEAEKNPLLNLQALAKDSERAGGGGQLLQLQRLNDLHFKDDVDSNSHLRHINRQGRARGGGPTGRNFVLPNISLNDGELAEANKLGGSRRKKKKISQRRHLMKEIAKRE